MPSFGEFAGSSAAGFAMPGMSGMANPIADAGTAFAATIKKMIAPMEKITDLATHFVQAIDPSLVDDLTRKFKDLNAVVGVALKPIVDVARDVVKYVSDRLLPLMKELNPIIQDLSDAAGDVLKQAMDELSRSVTAMMPMISSIKDVIVGLLKIMQDLWQVFLVLVKSIQTMVLGAFSGIGGSGKSVAEIMAQLRGVIQDVIRSLILFAARLMQAFGFTKGIDALIKGIDAKTGKPKSEDSTGMAVGPAAFKSIADLSRNTMLEAFRSSAMGGKSSNPAEQTNEYLKSLKADLEKIRAGTDEKQREIKAVIDKILGYMDKGITFLMGSEPGFMGKKGGQKSEPGIVGKAEQLGSNILDYLQNLHNEMKRFYFTEIKPRLIKAEETFGDISEEVSAARANYKAVKRVGKAVISGLTGGMAGQSWNSSGSQEE